jgi:hypothetical protein
MADQVGKDEFPPTPDPAAHRLSPGAPPQPAAELAPEDFYFDGPYLVFTEIYHRKRGYCCNSDCRHCPYR